MVIDKGCGIYLHFLLMSLTSRTADCVVRPFSLARVQLKKNDVFTHCMSSCSYFYWDQELLYSQNICQLTLAFQPQHPTLGKEYFGSFICVNAFLL